MRVGIGGKKVIMVLLPSGLNKSLGTRVGESSRVSSEHGDYSGNKPKSPEEGGSRGQWEV